MAVSFRLLVASYRKLATNSTFYTQLTFLLFLLQFFFVTFTAC
jgi:hypothetical protein